VWKFTSYCMLSLVAAIVSICFSAIFNFSLSNTWQAFIAMLFIFGPLWVFGWKKTGALKNKYPLAFIFGRFCLINLIIGYVLSLVLFLSGVIT